MSETREMLADQVLRAEEQLERLRAAIVFDEDEKSPGTVNTQISKLMEMLEDIRSKLVSSEIGGEGSASDGFATLTPEDLEGLPDELRSELSLTEGDYEDFRIRSVVQKLGGGVYLDKLLVELYRETGEIYQRSRLNSRLYRMHKKGLVEGVPGKKGVYRVPKR